MEKFIEISAEDFRDLKYEVKVEVSQEKKHDRCLCWLCAEDEAL